MLWAQRGATFLCTLAIRIVLNYNYLMSVFMCMWYTNGGNEDVEYPGPNAEQFSSHAEISNCNNYREVGLMSIWYTKGEATFYMRRKSIFFRRAFIRIVIAP